MSAFAPGTLIAFRYVGEQDDGQTHTLRLGEDHKLVEHAFGWSILSDKGRGRCPIAVQQIRRADPALALLLDKSIGSVAVVHSASCYICNDPEFAQMGLPLCRACCRCGGHVPADDDQCDACGLVEHEVSS